MLAAVYHGPEDLRVEQAAGIVNSGKIDLSPLVSARFALREAVAAFVAAENRTSLKAVLQPSS